MNNKILKSQRSSWLTNMFLSLTLHSFFNSCRQMLYQAARCSLFTCLLCIPLSKLLDESCGFGAISIHCFDCEYGTNCTWVGLFRHLPVFYCCSHLTWSTVSLMYLQLNVALQTASSMFCDVHVQQLHSTSVIMVEKLFCSFQNRKTVMYTCLLLLHAHCY